MPGKSEDETWKPKRRAATSAKGKLKEVSEEAGKRGADDDSDEDPDYDHAAAEKEKKRLKKLEEAKKEKEKCCSPAPGRPGRPAGRPSGGHVGRKRPLGNNIKCPFCDEGFNTVEIVMEHMMASHENDKKYHCKMCSKPDAPKEFPFRNNMEEHMTKEHNHQWTKRDKYDPLLEKAITKRVKLAAKFCVIPKDNATYKEDGPKPKTPRSYNFNSERKGNEKPAKIHCPHAPKCTHFFYNDDPRVLADHIMGDHLKKHRYHCSRCGPSITFNTHTDFTNHGRDNHKIAQAYFDHFTDIYLVCQRVPEEVKKLLNLTADDVEAIETMGRGCEDEQENEEKEEDDSLIIDEKWDVYMKGIRVLFHCSECVVDVEGRSGVVKHNREQHGI